MSCAPTIDHPIGRYEYIYGSGCGPNRRIEFYGSESTNRIWAVVSGKNNNSWKKIGDVAQNSMVKEVVSMAQKIKIMIDARKNFKIPEYPSEKYFSQLPYKEKIEMIKNLGPKGKYRIEITNSLCNNPFFETVEGLTFFDPRGDRPLM